MSHTESTQNMTEFDIVIVGGGLVGAALACGLSLSTNVRQRYRIALIEAQEIPSCLDVSNVEAASVSDFEPRVSALTAATQVFLDSLGIWSMLPETRIAPYENMRVWDGDGTADIAFSAADLHQPALGHIVENSVIVRALHRRLRELSAVDIMDQCTIERIDPQSGPALITLAGGQMIRASLVVAADGANSAVRKAFSIPTREWDYNHHAIVATVETTRSHGSTAWQRFSPSGPLAFLPLAGSGPNSDRFSSIVWSQSPEVAAELMALSDQAFCERLGTSIEHQLGNVVAVSKRFSIPLRQRHAKVYTKPGVVLLGDAAHTIHPLAGQGVNLGFLDVAVLLDELQRAAVRGLPADDHFTLKRYQRRRMGGNLAMMGLMETFKQLYASDDLALRWLRNSGMKWLNQTDFLKNQIVSHAMGLSIKSASLGNR